MFPWYNEVRRFFREHPNFDRRDFWFNVALFLTTQEIELAIIPRQADEKVRRRTNGQYPFKPLCLDYNVTVEDCIRIRNLMGEHRSDTRYFGKQGKGVMSLNPICLDQSSPFYLSTLEDPVLVDEELNDATGRDDLRTMFPYKRPVSLEEAMQAQRLYDPRTHNGILTPLEHSLFGSSTGVNDALREDPRNYHLPLIVLNGLLNVYACEVLRQRKGKQRCLLAMVFEEVSVGYGSVILPPLNCDSSSPNFGYAIAFPQVVDAEQYKHLTRVNFAERYSPVP